MAESLRAEPATTVLRECRDCGLFQEVPPLDRRAVARCARCDAELARRGAPAGAVLAASTVASALVFVAFGLPVIELRAAGRTSIATALTGPAALDRLGFDVLSIVVLATLLAAPALEVTALSLASLVAAIGRPSRAFAYVLGSLDRLAPWAMIDVFLVGVIVASSRLRAIADVTLGPALVAFGGAAITTLAARAALDPDAAWAKLRPDAPAPRPDAPLVTCVTCGRAQHARDGDRCARCAHVVRARKANSVTRTWALVVTGVLLYLPANLVPFLTARRLGSGGPNTILSGVRDLYEAHLPVLAVVVFVASIAVPLLKLAGLAAMLLATRARSARFLVGRTRLYRTIAAIGRWSMIDVFALSMLAGVVHLGIFGTVVPGGGAVAFAALVVVTMLATEAFDPRLMWDAAGANAEHAP